MIYPFDAFKLNMCSKLWSNLLCIFVTFAPPQIQQINLNMFSGVILGWTSTHMRLLIIAPSQIRCSTFFLWFVFSHKRNHKQACYLSMYDIHFGIIGIDI